MTGLWPFDAAFLLIKNKFKIAEKCWKSGRLFPHCSWSVWDKISFVLVLLHLFNRRLEPYGSYRHRSAGASSNMEYVLVGVQGCW